MDDATCDINWMRLALEEWKEAAKNGEEINAIMDQYSKDDQKQMEVSMFLFLARNDTGPHC